MLGSSPDDRKVGLERDFIGKAHRMRARLAASERVSHRMRARLAASETVPRRTRRVLQRARRLPDGPATPTPPATATYPGFQKTPASGGNVTLIDCRLPFQAKGRDSTSPRLPCPLPPTSLASLFMISRHRPARGTPTR
jgi:hypothetical protein